MHFTVADVNESRDTSAQIQQGVHFHGRLGRTKRCPVKQAQAQIDGGSIQRVEWRWTIQPQILVGVRFARPAVAFDNARKTRLRHKLHDLYEQRLADIHDPNPRSIHPGKLHKFDAPRFKSTPKKIDIKAVPVLAFSTVGLI